MDDPFARGYADFKLITHVKKLFIRRVYIEHVADGFWSRKIANPLSIDPRRFNQRLSL